MTDLAVVALMGLVTMAYRTVPLLLGPRDGTTGPPPEEAPLGASAQFLELAPLAVLASLIVPGAFVVDPSNPAVGTSAVLVAVALVLTRRAPILLVVTGAVAAALTAQLLTGAG